MFFAFEKKVFFFISTIIFITNINTKINFTTESLYAYSFDDIDLLALHNDPDDDGSSDD